MDRACARDRPASRLGRGSSGAFCGRRSETSHVGSRRDRNAFLDRNANRDVALAWKAAAFSPGAVTVLPCELDDLDETWAYFRRADLLKLSAVDATSFAIMKRARIGLAYTFDRHFAMVGFRLVG